MATRTDMVNFAARQGTPALCAALEAVQRMRPMTPEARLTHTVLVDVLCERHPEADAAFTAWAESDDSDPRAGVRAVIDAARKAAKRA